MYTLTSPAEAMALAAGIGTVLLIASVTIVVILTRWGK